MLVLAHYVRWKGYAVTIASFLVCALWLMVVLRHPDGMTWLQYERARGFLVGDLILLVLIVPIALFFAFLRLRQLLFHGRRAVWLEGNTLVFLNPYISHLPVKVPLADIASMTVGTTEHWYWRGVVLRLRDGGTVYVTIFLMQETPEMVMEKIQALLPAA